MINGNALYLIALIPAAICGWGLTIHQALAARRQRRIRRHLTLVQHPTRRAA